MRFGGTSGRASALAVSALALLAAPQPAAAAGSGSFSPTGSMSGPRLFHAAAPLQDGRVLVVGGSPDGAGGPGGLATTEIYNPATGTFAPGPSMGVIRNGPIAATLPDGRVLVAGGRGPLSSAQIYDPATNTFSGTGIMQDAREAAVAATLPDGRVLVAGGFDGAYLDTAEIWDPATNLWTPTDSMEETRAYAGAAPLADGRILVVAGYGPGLETTAELYNPATETFSSSGIGLVTPVIGNRGAAVAPLPDGRVLVAGGDQAGGDTLAFAEAFEPATLDFSPAGIGPLGTNRGFGAGAPLGDGRVLVSGGLTLAGITGSAEIFAATNTFTYAVSGRKLLVTVEAPGKVDLAAATGGKGKAAAAKRKRKALLRPASASGGPGTIELPLLLTKAAKRKLRQTGKVKLPASITFSPEGGVANAQPAKLKLKRKRKR